MIRLNIISKCQNILRRDGICENEGAFWSTVYLHRNVSSHSIKFRSNILPTAHMGNMNVYWSECKFQYPLLNNSSMQTIFISSIHSWLRKKIRYHEYRNRQRNRINHEKYTKNNQILLYFVLCEQNNMKDCNRKFYWCTKNVYNSIDCGD